MKLLNNLHNIIVEDTTPWYRKVFESDDFESLWPITKMFGGDACRSTSTGDMVLIGTKKYECAIVGWELV